MKTTFLKFFTALSVVAILATGCDKKEDETPDNNQNATENYKFTDSYGVLAAIKSISYQNAGGFTIPVEINTAVAVFPQAAGSSTFASAGTVTINGSSLKKYENNSYIYDNLLSPLNFNTVEWNVSGEGDVPVIQKTVARGFPAFSGYSTLPETFSLASGLTISLGNAISNADSVVVVVAGSKNSSIKTVRSGTANVTFTSTELSAIGTGAAGLISVTPYNYQPETISGRKYYFINESNYTKINVNITQ